MEIEILDKDRLLWWCEQAGIPAEGRPALLSMARQICADEALHGIFTEFYHQTTIQGGWHREWSPLPVHPLVENRLGEQSSLFYLLGYMAGLPAAAREYERRGISMDIFRATMFDIAFYYAEDSDVRGRWCFEHFPWLWRHLTGELFRLGRLQFMLAPFDWGVTAFRKKDSGEILLLADPNLPLRADGFAEGAGGQPSDTPAWQPIFAESENGWRGSPIAPYGYALKEEIFLPREAWDVALRRGDTVFEIHIPRGKSLTAEECRDSFRQAFDFFARQAPTRTIRASCCHTWFFTPQLQQMLGPESSIVRFQREFYLFPFPGGPSFLWTFVFGGKYPDAASAPRDTSLRRTVLDWMAQGKEIFDLPGVMFHGPEAWGSQPYMTRWDAQHSRPVNP